MSRDNSPTQRLLVAIIVLALIVAPTNIIATTHGTSTPATSSAVPANGLTGNTGSESTTTTTASITTSTTTTATTTKSIQSATRTQTTSQIQLQQKNNGTSEGKPHPKVAADVLDQVNNSRSATNSSATIASTGSSPNHVHVVIETKQGYTGEVKQLIQKQAGTIQVRFKNEIRAKLPAAALDALTKSANVQFIRSPREASTQEITSEGIYNINALSVHQRGYTGDEVTVAVIDNGFNTSNPNIRENIVKTKDYTGKGIGDESNGLHGTATAEIVADTAPNANLVLIRVKYEIDIKKAINYIETETEADIASMSMGIPSGPFDGSSELDQMIATSVQDGTMWFVSSGNAAGGKHLNQVFADSDQDDWHNFTQSDELLNIYPASNRLAVYVNWNDWQYSDQDYDVYLYDPYGSLVAKSETTQSGFQPPLEAVTLDNPIYSTYYLAIRSHDSREQADFDIFVNDGTSLEYYTNTRSVKRPATEEHVIAVGAVNYQDESLESFSSRGPTIDGQRKPDIVAPDRVTTSEKEPFFGTSAAAPYAAGVAALMASANSSLTPPQIESRLKTTATTITSGEPNNKTGWGLIDAAAATAPQNPTSTTITTGSISQSEEGSVSVNVEFDTTPKQGKVAVKLTGPDGATVTKTASVDTSSTTTTVTGIDASSLAEGDIIATAKITDSNGYSNPAGFTATSPAVTKDTRRPTVTTAMIQSAPINKSDAGTPQRVTVTFNESMAQDTIPTVEITNVSDGPYTVSGDFVNTTTWTGTVTIPDTSEETTATITVSGGADRAGNVIAPTAATRFRVDTDAPQNPSATIIRSQPINQSNEDAVTVEVDFNSPPEQGTLGVHLTDAANNTLSTTAPVNTASTTTQVGVNVSTLADGNLTATATLVDTVGNENPNGATAESSAAVKDTSPPTISSFIAEQTRFGNIQIQFETDQILSALQVSISSTAGNSAILTASDFTGNGSDRNPYTATYNVSQQAEYTVTFDTAVDEHGNDGASDHRDTVDYLPPSIQSATTHDPDDDGSIEQLTLTFTEALDTQQTTVTSDAITLSSGSVTNVSVNAGTARMVVLDVVSLSGSAAQPTVMLDANATGVTVTDTAGNTQTETQTVTSVDAAPPTITNFTVNRTGSEAFEIAMTSSEALSDIAVTITDPNGQNTTLNQSAFQNENTTYTATYDVQHKGQYTVSLTAVTDTANNDAEPTAVRTLTVHSVSSGDGGGNGGGSGGGGGNVPPPSMRTSVEQTSSGARLDIQSARPGERASATLPGVTAGPITVNRVKLGFANENPHILFAFTGEDGPPSGTSPPPGEDVLGHLTVSAQYGSASIVDRTSYQFEVPASALPEEATLDDVTVYHYTNGSWIPAQVTHHGTTFTATMSRLTTVAVVVEPSREETVTNHTTTTTTSNENKAFSGNQSTMTTQAGLTESTLTETDDGVGIPGFTGSLALIALGAGLLFARHLD